MQCLGRDRALRLCEWRDRRGRRRKGCQSRFARILCGKWDLPSERDYRHLVIHQHLSVLSRGESLTDMWGQCIEDGILRSNAKAIGIGKRFMELVFLVTVIRP